MASLLDLAEARLRGLLDVQRQPRPSMVGLLGGKEPQGTLASTISGYTPPQMQAMSNQQVMDYARNVASSARQNLQNQMSDLDRALVMDEGGINVGDRQALARLMDQIPGLMGATAYHGTPHTIRGKFDISKVGTGEGAQAYGHGMYFAESPTVAEYYKNALKTKDQDIINNAIERLVYVNNKDTSKIADALRMEGFNTERITPELENSIKKIVQATDPTTNTVSKAGINEYANLSKLVPEQGNLYKVDIPDEYIPKMIDWDKPFAEQPEKLKKLFSEINPIAVLQKDPSNEFTRWLRLPSTAQELQDLGYKGIKYKDAGSRSIEGEKTFNYVVFDPSEVKILEKNKKKIEGLLN